MLVNFTQPDPKSVQLQGQTLDIYLPKSLTVQEYNLGKNSGLIQQFLLLGFGTTRQDLADANTITYGGPDTIDGKAAERIVLVPKNKDLQQRIQKIELWLSPETGLPFQHKIYQPGGDYQLFQFTNTAMAQNLPDSELKLKLPKNVKVEHPQQ
jgi:outer membrane lipoprotein-sorting protein